MSVLLKKRKNADGTTSLFLCIWNDGKRTYEFLNQLKLTKASGIADREKNKENLALANRIAVKRAHELAATDYSLVTDTGKKTQVVAWMQTYVDNYEKKDIRSLAGVLKRFRDFLIKRKIKELTFGQLSEQLVIDFQDYLRTKSIGEGSGSYFSRFKKMMKAAYRARLIDRNPAADVKTNQGKAKKKDTLTLEEIQTLAATRIESDEVKCAFLFSTVTGLRWADVKALTWSCINGREMTVTQTKTDDEVQINLNDTAIKLIGKRGKPADPVFELPTANGANKTVKAWVKRAGITKKITWHNARHSYGTNLIFHGTDVITVSTLMGHSTLKHTQRYVTAAKHLKERATDKLNFEL
jgi:integrase/recombinase XerD